jgi:hypothetical protein
MAYVWRGLANACPLTTVHPPAAAITDAKMQSRRVKVIVYCHLKSADWQTAGGVAQKAAMARGMRRAMKRYKEAS